MSHIEPAQFITVGDRTLATQNPSDKPDTTLHTVHEIDPETLTFTDPEVEEAFKRAPIDTKVHVTYIPAEGTPVVTREVIRDITIPVEDVKVVTEDTDDIFGSGVDSQVTYEVTGATRKKLEAEAEKRGEVLAGITVDTGLGHGNVTTVEGRDARYFAIVPIDEGDKAVLGDVDFEELTLYSKRSEARAALRDKVEDARQNKASTIALGVIGVNLRDNGKVFMAGRTTPWKPGDNVRRVKGQAIFYAVDYNTSEPVFGTIFKEPAVD